jgi:putative transposase
MVFHHKNIRLPAVNYRGRRLYFLTVCCDHRRKVFADSRHAERLIALLRHEANAHDFAVHAYCLMPEHLHLLLEGKSHESDLLRFVQLFKLNSTLALQAAQGEPVWQKKFYDHILRARDSMDRVAWYIWMNPVRKALCSKAQDYPFSGSCTVEWKERTPPSPPWVPAWKKTVSAQ